MQKLPTHTQALVVKKADGSNGKKPLYRNAAVLEMQPIPKLQKGHVLVKINAVSFNHRDLWIRKGLYPSIIHGSVFGADGAGVIVASGDYDEPLLNKRVFLTPTRGWERALLAPESPKFTILGGGGHLAPLGTFAQYVVVEREQVIPSPDHLDDEHICAWPVAGVTAWRAVAINASVQQGDNVLITGIGGGVALLAMQICLALGANVYVSSGSEEKIKKALSLGAKGGVNYKTDDWAIQLGNLLREKEGKNALLSSVIDSGGGDLLGKLGKILKPGGRVVVYGMTANPKMTFTMKEVLKNHQLLGSTMGSHKDLIEGTEFLAKHKIVPLVSHILNGLESAEEGLSVIAKGEQFGKVVIRIRHDSVISAKL
ncbi:hypothetical protein QCA50_003452 [Cerrena zonata]|uniref:Enoyl reductase (ER) domain-containing protein n=1 Tax=Cerrena zonata TaxID=2478898 RepID=A0AAW0GWB4_9APHY